MSFLLGGMCSCVTRKFVVGGRVADGACSSLAVEWPDPERAVAIRSQSDGMKTRETPPCPNPNCTTAALAGCTGGNPICLAPLVCTGAVDRGLASGKFPGGKTPEWAIEGATSPAGATARALPAPGEVALRARGLRGKVGFVMRPAPQ